MAPSEAENIAFPRHAEDEAAVFVAGGVPAQQAHAQIAGLAQSSWLPDTTRIRHERRFECRYGPLRAIKTNDSGE
jgi:hypothetical protein